MTTSTARRKVGPYRLEAVIGQGGMGVVYRAHQPGTDRPVAVKVLGEMLARHPAFLESFLRETRSTAALLHPHILPVYDAGLAGGQPYLVMAYLPGGTLANRIAGDAGGLPLEIAVRVAVQVALALDYAHQCGVIHRDLKPGNILFDEAGNAYLTDFGIAQIAASAGEFEPPVGTPQYMAPEVRAGQPATPHSDLYTLGVVLFEMLTGRLPTQGDDAAMVVTKQGQRVSDLRLWRPDVPLGVRVVVEQSLHQDPTSRPARARAIAAALTLAARPVLRSSIMEPLIGDVGGSNGQGHLTPPPVPASPSVATDKGPTPVPRPANGPSTQPNSAASRTPPPARVMAPTQPTQRVAAPKRQRPPRWLSWLVGLCLLVPLIVLFVWVMISLGQSSGF